jgi:MFS transporter, putative metabolite:H+ symporter
LKESARFERGVAKDGPKRTGIFHIWSTPYAGRVMKLALIWAFTYICTQTAITFFKSHAVEDLGRTEGFVGQVIGGAAIVSMPLVFMVGRLFDRIGRKPAATIIFLATAIGCVGAYTTTNNILLFVFAVLAVFGAAAVLPALNAFNSELFPTELRSDAFAWSNNLLGRIGYVLAPLGVGALAERLGWGPAVSATA